MCSINTGRPVTNNFVCIGHKSQIDIIMKVVSVCLAVILFVCCANAANYWEECRGDCSGRPIETRKLVVRGTVIGYIERAFSFNSNVRNSGTFDILST